MDPVSRFGHLIRQAVLLPFFGSSRLYWERRYRLGGDSGIGSYGQEAEYKAEVLNAFVRDKKIESAIELGCGDGHVLSLVDYPRYLGLDVSKTAIERCGRQFAGDASKSFLWYDPKASANFGDFLQADLTLSLDVLFHLVEDAIYDSYLCNLFEMSRRYVIVYSSDVESVTKAPHVRHRKFTQSVAQRFPHFKVIDKRAPSRANNPAAKSFVTFERA